MTGPTCLPGSRSASGPGGLSLCERDDEEWKQQRRPLWGGAGASGGISWGRTHAPPNASANLRPDRGGGSCEFRWPAAERHPSGEGSRGGALAGCAPVVHITLPRQRPSHRMRALRRQLDAIRRRGRIDRGGCAVRDRRAYSGACECALAPPLRLSRCAGPLGRCAHAVLGGLCAERRVASWARPAAAREDGAAQGLRCLGARASPRITGVRRHELADPVRGRRRPPGEGDARARAGVGSQEGGAGPRRPPRRRRQGDAQAAPSHLRRPRRRVRAGRADRAAAEEEHRGRLQGDAPEPPAARVRASRRRTALAVTGGVRAVRLRQDRRKGSPRRRCGTISFSPG